MTATLDLTSAAADDPRLPLTTDTIVVYADLSCSFAHVAVHRLHETRTRPGLDGTVHFDHRAFPLELFNISVSQRPGVDSEIAAVGRLEPEAGWRLWQGPVWRYPVAMLPALEAVQAAKAQGWAASERLDRALRTAFWAGNRCISGMRHLTGHHGLHGRELRRLNLDLFALPGYRRHVRGGIARSAIPAFRRPRAGELSPVRTAAQGPGRCRLATRRCPPRHRLQPGQSRTDH